MSDELEDVDLSDTEVLLTAVDFASSFETLQAIHEDDTSISLYLNGYKIASNCSEDIVGLICMALVTLKRFEGHDLLETNSLENLPTKQTSPPKKVGASPMVNRVFLLPCQNVGVCPMVNRVIYKNRLISADTGFLQDGIR